MTQILVVDDDLGTLETFGFALRSERFDVVVAETARQALERVQSWTPHLVVCDLHLPDATGLDILRQMREMGIGAPFVVLTGFGSVTSALEAGRLGVADYVEKPVTTDELLGLVKAHTVHIQNADEPRSFNRYPARVRYVLEQRYAEHELGVRTVARALGISTQHVCRITKHQFGLTFADLLRNVRMREARRLLLERSFSMKEIAFRVGFRHPSQFTRAFRQHWGISPTAYRNQGHDSGATEIPG